MTPEPEAQWLVALDDGHVRVTDAAGETRSIAQDDIAAILIQTDDSGPWGMDLKWLLLDAAGALACSVPQGATGEQALIDWMFTLKGFDHEAMIWANSSVERANFELWRAP